MSNLNITHIQRRKPRRSMLGTHRGYSIGFQLDEEEAPPTSETDTNKNKSTISVNITNMTRRPPRKSMLGKRNVRRESTFSLLPETSFNESSQDVESTEVTSPPKKKLETIFSQKSNDSFEEHETFMMANETENSVLATTLLDNTIVEMNAKGPALKNDVTMLEKTVKEPEVEDSTLTDILNTLNLIIENNTRTVNQFYKQIEDIKNEIEEKNRQTEEIVNVKCRLMKKFNLSDSPSESAQMKSPKVPKMHKSKSPKWKAIIPDQKENVESPKSTASSSRQVIRELRSTIKYLKTPRSSRRPKPSTILTPHSMAFTIESQWEKLQE